MTEPLVVVILREFREALEAKEGGLMRSMATSWLQVERSLEADIAALAREIAERHEAGTIITEQIIWRQERYQRLKSQMEAEILAWNKTYAIPTIEQAQLEFGSLGVQSAQQAIMASYPGIGLYFDRLPVSAVETMIGFLGNGAPLNSLLKNDYPEALDGLTQALINGIARGFHPSKIALEMADGSAMGLERALLITRTEAARTYRHAATEQYRHSGVVSGFKRLVKKETACMACLMLDGELLRSERELDDHPRGKCIPVPHVEGTNIPQWETGQEWFMTLDPERQEAMMGPEKFALWRSGAFGLEDLAKLSHSKEWGSSPRVATIAELVK
jgi:hypothetical protein